MRTRNDILAEYVRKKFPIKSLTEVMLRIERACGFYYVERPEAWENSKLSE